MRIHKLLIKYLIEGGTGERNDKLSISYVGQPLKYVWRWGRLRELSKCCKIGINIYQTDEIIALLLGIKKEMQGGYTG
jgi:hypothetical protein